MIIINCYLIKTNFDSYLNAAGIFVNNEIQVETRNFNRYVLIRIHIKFKKIHLNIFQVILHK